MNKKYLLKLIELIEHQVVGMLIENNIVTYINKPNYNSKRNNYKQYNNFKNIRITPEYSLAFGNLFVDQEETREFIKRLRSKYVPNKRGSAELIKKDIEVFLFNNEQYSLDYLEAVLDLYIEESMALNSGKYLMGLNNIFVRRDRNTVQYPILNIIEQFKDNPVLLHKEKKLKNNENKEDIDGLIL